MLPVHRTTWLVVLEHLGVCEDELLTGIIWSIWTLSTSVTVCVLPAV